MLPTDMSGNSVPLFMTRILYYPTVLLFLFNLLQRRYGGKGVNKRMATLLMAVMLLLVWGVSFFTVRFGWPDFVLAASVGVLILVAVLNKKRIFPFRISCRQCGRRLEIRHILFLDENRCDGCLTEKTR